MTTLHKYVLGLIFCLFTLTSCSETNTEASKDNYSDTKKIIVDVLKSDEGKKAIEDILADESVKTELIMNQEDITKTIETTLTSDKEKQFWENAFKDPKFVKAVCERYKELRDTILSTEYVSMFIDDTVDYLGNARLREESRWRETFEKNHALHIVKEGKGYEIDRNRDTYEEEILRMKDMMSAHGEWLDEYMDDFLNGYVNEEIETVDADVLSTFAALFIVSFMIIIVLINRKVKGQ